jgi:hypothetical protein
MAKASLIRSRSPFKVVAQKRERVSNYGPSSTGEGGENSNLAASFY